MGGLCYCAGCCGVYSFAVNVGGLHILQTKGNVKCQTCYLCIRRFIIAVINNKSNCLTQTFIIDEQFAGYYM